MPIKYLRRCPVLVDLASKTLNTMHTNKNARKYQNIANHPNNWHTPTQLAPIPSYNKKVNHTKQMSFCPDRFFAEANSAYCHDSKGLRYGQFLIRYLGDHYLDVYCKIESTQDCFQDDSKIGEFVKFIYFQETP